MKAAELKCIGKNLRTVIDPKNSKQIFKIPNFCIEDPVYETDYSAKEQIAHKILEKKINVRYSY